MSEILGSVENQNDSEKMWNENKEKISNYLRNMIDAKCKYVVDKDKEFEDLYKKEENFFKIIVEKVGEFAKINPEKKHVILLDIDETIGKGFQYKKTNKENKIEYAAETVLRPALKPLLEYLRAEYPNLDFGFITTRSGEKVKKQLKDPNNLEPIDDFINTEYIFSTQDDNVKGFGDDFTFKHKTVNEQKSYFINHPLVDKEISAEAMYSLETSGILEKLESLRLYVQNNNNSPEFLVVDDWEYPKYLKNGVRLDINSGFFPSIY